MSSEIASGRNCRASERPVAPAGGHDHLEAPVASQAQEDARLVRVVLDDEQHRIAFLDVLAVVGDVLFARLPKERGSHAALADRPPPRPIAVTAGVSGPR